MKRLLLLLLLFLAAPVWAEDYTLTLSGDSTAVCTFSTSAGVDAKADGTYAMQAGDITAFACTISEASLSLDETDLQYPAGLDYRVSNGKVTALDLQTTTGNMLQVGNATPTTIDSRWYLFGTGTLLAGDTNRVTIMPVSSAPLDEQAATMSPSEWRRLDTANLWREVAVTSDEVDTIVATYGGQNFWPTSGSPEVFRAWNSAARDDDENRWFFQGGGHSAYGGNEVYEFDFDTLVWSRVIGPAPLNVFYDATPPEVDVWLPEDVNPADGIPDSPAMSHFYDSLYFSSGTGLIVAPQHEGIWSGGSSGDNPYNVFYRLDPDTATWTVHAGKSYKKFQCEYIPSEAYGFCLDGLSTSSHQLHLLHDNGTATECGTISTGLVGEFGILYLDPNSGNFYALYQSGLHQITIEADDCDPTFSLITAWPSWYDNSDNLDRRWDFHEGGVAGAVEGGDDKLFLWNGNSNVLVYDIATNTFDLRWFDAQVDTGPDMNDGNQPLVYQKWDCLVSPAVCIGISEPRLDDTSAGFPTPFNQNHRGGVWMWKRGPDPADDRANVATAFLDGSTQTTLSLHLPLVQGDRDYDGTAFIEYREVGTGTWIRGVDMYRQRSEQVYILRGHQENPIGWSGMIWGLEPDTDYDVRITYSDPDGTLGVSSPQVIGPFSTKAEAITDYTGFGTTVVTTKAQLAAAAIAQCDGAGPGHIISIPADTTIVAANGFVDFGPPSSGDCGANAANPIILRGENRDTSVIDCTDAVKCLRVLGGYAIVENLTITSSTDTTQSGIFLVARSPACTIGNITIRNVTIDRVTVSGIEGGCHHHDVHIVDNIILGDEPQLTISGGGGAIGVKVPGQNVEIAHNTIGGFVDGVGGQYTNHMLDISKEQNRSFALHHNWILWTSDDGLEMDFCHRNCVTYENLITNTGGGISFQPIWGGPAYAFRNIFINNNNSAFKIQGEQDDPHGVLAVNNTIVKNGSGYASSGGGAEPDSVFLANNLFCGAGTTQYNPAGTKYELLYQQVVLRPGTELLNGDFHVFKNNAFCQDGYFAYGPANAVDHAAWLAQSATYGLGVGSLLLEGETVFSTYVPDFDDGGSGFVWDDHLRDPTGESFFLDAGSSARNAGIPIPGITAAGDANPDIGACDSDNPIGCVVTGTFYGVR